MYSEFEALDTVVVAVSQEDKSLDNYEAFLSRIGGGDRRFEVVCDVERRVTLPYDRTSAYLIDKQGVVREIFPMIIHARPSWKVILHELESMIAMGEKQTVEAGARR